MAKKIKVEKMSIECIIKKATLTFASNWGLLQFILVQGMSDIKGCDWVECISEVLF